MDNALVCGKRVKPKSYYHLIQTLSVKDIRNIIRMFKPDQPNLYKMKRQELCDLLFKIKGSRSLSTNLKLPNIQDRGYINNRNNSCYIDSIFVALLHYPNNLWVQKHLIKSDPSKHFQSSSLKSISKQIWSSIKNIRQSLVTKSSQSMFCTSIRKLFKEFDEEYKKHFNVDYENTEWLYSQSDPVDVLHMLVRVFNLQPDVTRMYQVSEKRTENVLFNTPMITYDMLLKGDPIRVDSVIPYQVIKQGPYTIKEKILSARLLYVQILRNLQNRIKLTTKVIPQDFIRVGKRQMQLVSVVVHVGSSTNSGHYVAFIKDYKSSDWYLFDDLRQHYQRIGSFNTMLKYDGGFLQTNAVGLIYL